MMTCKACGALLQSDGFFWQCPFRWIKEIHPTHSTEITDMRLPMVQQRKATQ